MLEPPHEIVTERLRLRAPKRGDVTPLHDAIAETSELVPWLPWARIDHGCRDPPLSARRGAWSRQSAFEFV